MFMPDQNAALRQNGRPAKQESQKFIKAQNQANPHQNLNDEARLFNTNQTGLAIWARFHGHCRQINSEDQKTKQS
jgi:hypothetical protein